jgi:polyhydroxyalkanoate synthesis regulator phasin
MKKQQLFKKIIVAAVSGVIILSLGSLAFAEETTDSSENSFNKFKGGFYGMMRKGFRGLSINSEKLVEEGILSQEQADKVADYVKEQAEERSAEFEKIKNMTKEERDAYRAQNPILRSNLVDELIAKGIISQEQGDKINEAYPKISGAFSSGTSKRMNFKLEDRLGELVADGTLTQEQVDAIIETLPQRSRKSIHRGKIKLDLEGR